MGEASNSYQVNAGKARVVVLELQDTKKSVLCPGRHTQAQCFCWLLLASKTEWLAMAFVSACILRVGEGQ